MSEREVTILKEVLFECPVVSFPLLDSGTAQPSICDGQRSGAAAADQTQMSHWTGRVLAFRMAPCHRLLRPDLLQTPRRSPILVASAVETDGKIDIEEKSQLGSQASNSLVHVTSPNAHTGKYTSMTARVRST